MESNYAHKEKMIWSTGPFLKTKLMISKVVQKSKCMMMNSHEDCTALKRDEEPCKAVMRGYIFSKRRNEVPRKQESRETLLIGVNRGRRNMFLVKNFIY